MTRKRPWSLSFTANGRKKRNIASKEQTDNWIPRFSTCSSCSPSFCSLSFIFSYFRRRICSLWLKTDRCQDGVVFTCVSKAIHIYSFGFALLHYMIGLKTLRHFAIQSEVLKPIVTRLHMFPALHVSNLYLLQVLIGSLVCPCPLWLARATTFVLALQHLKLLKLRACIMVTTFTYWHRHSYSVKCALQVNTCNLDLCKQHCSRMLKLETYRIGLDYSPYSFFKWRNTAELKWRKQLFTQA